MGERNSTETRVMPVFDELLARQPEGWITRLVQLVSPSHATFSAAGELLDWGWGEDEVPLQAPRSLLTALVSRATELMTPPPDGRFGSNSPTARQKRAALFGGDDDIRREALRLLNRKRVPKRGWYVFEGETWPDVFIETEHAVVVIEGKRTEASITTCTTWMPITHQMLRHLDAALEIAAGRKPIGFFIVEGEGNTQYR